MVPERADVTTAHVIHQVMSTFPPPSGPPARARAAATPLDRPASFEPSTAPPPPFTAPHPTPTFSPPRAPHETLPLAAAVGAVVVLVVSLVASKYFLDGIIGFEWPLLVYVTLLALVAYGPSMIWCRYASRRFATGRFFDDVGLRPRWSDLGWGPLVWLAAIGTQLVIGALVLALDVPLANNTDGISELSADRTYVIAIVITAVVAAPFVEEIVFRGVVMRGLLGRMPVVAAILLQGVLFGVAHVDPVRGVGNIGLAIVLSGIGVALGGGAYLLRRIGPAIVAHAILNGVVLTLVLTDALERLQS